LFRDSGQTRKLIFDNVLAAANKIEPVSNPRHTLSVENARWSGPADYSLAEQKQAVLSRGTLGRRLVGDLILRDTTGTELARRSTQLARVPYMTDRGTFIQGGNEYTMAHQMRLKPGVFTRRKQNGELESHVNVSRGFSHRIFMDPATGVFRVAIGQAKIPIVPLLKTMGISDQQLRDAWGNEQFQENLRHADPQAIGKLYRKLHSHGVAPDVEQGPAVAFEVAL
jgi:DNA-directed RNA polymerase beta subunit